MILGTIDDLVGDLLYYDRKGDEELPQNSIEEALQKGEITIDDMVGKFREVLEENT